MDPYIGEIRIFAGNFAPTGWALCQGQLLPISSNTALFSLLGTMYGGDGRTTFGLPDFRGRVPVSFGQGPGLSPYAEGQTGGEQTVHLQTTQIPAHTHSAMGNPNAGTVGSPANAVWAGSGGRGRPSTYTAGAQPPNPLQMNGFALSPTGQTQPHNNMAPYLSLNFIICLQGIFPPRS
ncbi:MAG: tail fiber protein [Blastocatellia bacterium]|nr:tail fiber protein [Blastocatellia bacterium]